MPGAPRAASASPSEPLGAAPPRWRQRQRLLRKTDFAAFSNAPAPWRAARRWVAVSARSPLAPAVPGAAGAVRFGFAVARRQCRRAVARNAVRRVLREAARHAAVELERLAPASGLDVLFRIKSPLPGPDLAGWRAVKLALRREADELLGELQAKLRARGGLKA